MPLKDTRLLSLPCGQPLEPLQGLPTLPSPNKVPVPAGARDGLRIQQKKSTGLGKGPSPHPLLLFPPPGSNTKKPDQERSRSSQVFVPLCVVLVLLTFVLLVALTGESHPDIPHGEDAGQAPLFWGRGDCRTSLASRDAPQAKHQACFRGDPFFHS